MQHVNDPHNEEHNSMDIYSTTKKGIWAAKVSFLGLFITACLQLIVVLFSGSVALLADTIHNFGDALTAVPLWVAFSCGRWKANKKFTYGYGRVEDLAGVAIVIIILISAIVAGYESIYRLFHPSKLEFLWAIVAASVIGFLGNEFVAFYRIKVGKEISSTALIVDGQHARADGLTSLSVSIGAIGVYLGYPIADPLIGLLITVGIFHIVHESAESVFVHLVDGVEPEIIDEIRKISKDSKKIRAVNDIRARWLGHKLFAELSVTVDRRISVEKGHDVAMDLRCRLLDRLNYISDVTIHVDPNMLPGRRFHR